MDSKDNFVWISLVFFKSSSQMFAVMPGDAVPGMNMGSYCVFPSAPLATCPGPDLALR